VKHEIPGSGDVEVAPYFEGTGTAQVAYYGEDAPTDEGSERGKLNVVPSSSQYRQKYEHYSVFQRRSTSVRIVRRSIKTHSNIQQAHILLPLLSLLRDSHSTAQLSVSDDTCSKEPSGEELTYRKVYTNFIKNPRLTHTGHAPIGAPKPTKIVAGALGMGAQAAAGITTFNQFWCYIIPLFGAYIADTYLGRYVSCLCRSRFHADHANNKKNTIIISVGIAIVGHIILVASSAPGVLDSHTGTLAAFILGLIIMGAGTGGFKPNISPLVAEQMPIERMTVITDKKGKRVIVDPAATVNRVYNYFYLFINIGALVGQIGMSYSAYYVGFWLAFLLPTLVFLCCPIVLYTCRNKYIRSPPQGSVLGPALRLWAYAQRGRWSLNPVTTYKNLTHESFWQNVKPSNIPVDRRPSWMTFDDMWVDEVRRGFLACKVFLWYPVSICFAQTHFQTATDLLHSSTGFATTSSTTTSPAKHPS